MVALEEQNRLFALIGEKLNTKIECFVIGGSAMLYYGAKQVTKDIDLVFLNEKDRNIVARILKELGFETRNAKILYFEKENIPVLLQRGDARFDLFSKKIVCFELSDSIIEKVKEVYEYGNLIIKVVSPEDIILLKCATERAGDRLDAAELIAKFNINWETIMSESIAQTKEGREIFPVFLYDFLCELKEDLKADIPNDVIKRVMKIGEKAMLQALKKKHR